MHFVLLIPTLVLLVAGFTSSAHAAPAEPNRVELDATEAPTGLLHSHLRFPANPGTLTLAYPKWIPGEHSPGGPLSQVVRLTFSANGKPLVWHRDDLDIFMFHVEVPEGVTEVRADLDFACVLGQEGFQSDICSSYDQLVVNWWLVVLYPISLPNDADPFQANIRLPAGWKYNTSLPLAGAGPDNTIQFGVVPLKTLVDSPLIAAEHLQIFPLGGPTSALLAISAESAASLAVPAKVVAQFRRMLAETEAEFDGPRYKKYNLQISLGDAIDHYTLEHFESSENRLPSAGLSDPRILLTTATMIPHEYIHSWNGKYRTPTGLDIKTYQDPMRAGLIWVYEGLTDYISSLIAVRSGFWTEDQLTQSLALDAAEMTYHTGRTWRSLQDTTVGAQMLLVSPNAWVSARRNVDFYPESGLMWLEADAIIREATHGRRSLDDFCAAFFGSHSTSQPYSFDDVAAALDDLTPYDWKSFLRSHLDSLSPNPPLAGIERSGWKLVYTDQKSELIADMEQVHKVDLLWPEWQSWGFADLRYSIGLLVEDDGTVLDSSPMMSGYAAGVMPGMRLTGVNGAPFSIVALEASVRATASGGKLELTVANGTARDFVRLDYHAGLKYPHLVRDTSRPDLLQQILAPRIPLAAAHSATVRSPGGP
jgi:predicted metalloprotease with PDZ domain